MSDNVYCHLFDIVHHWMVRWRFPFYCRVNIMEVYIERNNLQHEQMRYSKTRLTLFTFNFARRRIRPPNAEQEASNIRVGAGRKTISV